MNSRLTRQQLEKLKRSQEFVSTIYALISAKSLIVDPAQKNLKVEKEALSSISC